MAGYRASNRVILQCVNETCGVLVAQEVSWGKAPHAVLCLDCQTRVGNWICGEMRRLDALEARQEPQCELCGEGPLVGVVRPCRDAGWVNVCGTCYRMVKALQDLRE